LIRGAGVRGLAGIEPSSREGFIRPLIECERPELRAYLEKRGIAFREDASNLDRSFLRNRIRHDLLPAIKRDYNPSIERVLRRTAANMAEVEGLLVSLGSRLFEDSLQEEDREAMSLDSKKLRAYDKTVWGYVFRRAYGIIAGDSFSLTRAHIEALTDLVESRPSGTVIHLPGGIRAGMEYGTVSIYRHRARPEAKRFEKEVRLPGTTELPELGGSLDASLAEAADVPKDIRAGDPAVEYFDIDYISPPLKLRNRRRGDRIRLFGSGGEKKLKDVMIDLKIRLDTRDTTPVLVDGRGLLWLIGFKRSDRAKITGTTKKALALRWRKTD
jgi:tRNA(Ile)-lysidine synthase